MIGFLIHSPVEYYAQTTPDHPALSFQGNELSYAELDQRSNQLAHALLSRGVARQDRVGIFMHKSLELGVAIYGILKAGCVFVPLDPFMPVDRLAFILDDCDITHLISSDVLSEQIRQLDKISDLNIYGVSQPLSNDANAVTQLSWTDINKHNSESPDVKMIDQELGYIMYTSGSTGSPKGMMHTHHGSISYARWGAQHVNLQPDDRVASHAPLHFDLSIFDFFSTAQAGATVSLIPETVTRFPASWTNIIDSERISVVFTVPYTLITMLEQGAMDKRDLSSLRWILFGGEPFPPRKLRLLMQALEGVRFTNVYGPAEAPSCTCYDVVMPEENNDDPLPIGYVSRNSSDLIIDEHDQECDVGTAGELCIRSSTLTRGYWNRPDLNARAYLYREGLGPFPTVYFRTGDRVVRQADGQLQFLGRIDRMVKTRGHRVELDEVEAVFSAIETVQEAAAFVVPDEFGSQSIMVAAKLDSGSDLDVAALFRSARSKLPAYAIPREIEISNALPHTSSGKIDRNALSALWQEKNQPEETT